ncbi:MAG: carboxypeptidase-like regulatory domain-containing protein, partial [Bacteroidales bacterium]|nr:carboxypeptidase-like regulatory domain-containing protein [Bacteroidales bacterium]
MTKNYLVLIIVALMMMPWQLLSQANAIQGYVISSEDNLPIPGATVLVKGTTTGTTTGIDGEFVLQDVTIPTVLVISYVGMKTLELPLTEPPKVLNIILDPDISLLDEVVVIGYGTVKKKDLTGAVSMVDSKTINKLSPVKIEQALQGTMTGVNVTEQSGAPGAGLDIRIRG